MFATVLAGGVSDGGKSCLLDVLFSDMVCQRVHDVDKRPFVGSGDFVDDGRRGIGGVATGCQFF